MPLGSKLFPPPGGSHFYIELFKEQFKQQVLSNRSWEFDQTGQE